MKYQPKNKETTSRILWPYLTTWFTMNVGTQVVSCQVKVSYKLVIFCLYMEKMLAPPLLQGIINSIKSPNLLKTSNDHAPLCTGNHQQQERKGLCEMFPKGVKNLVHVDIPQKLIIKKWATEEFVCYTVMSLIFVGH